MQNFRTRIAKLSRQNEQGVSLVEILAYISILAILLAGVITLVVSSTNASSRLTTTTATQAEVNNTQASILRDLSLTQTIFKAGGDHIQFAIAQNNKQYKITIFSYGGATERDQVPSYIDNILTSNPQLNDALPVEAAVMSIREEYGSSAKTITTLTKGYDPEAYKNRDLWLFSYYDKNNEMIPLNNLKQFDNPTEEIKEISRVGFRVAADAAGRASKVQAESSVTPPLSKTNISSNLIAPEKPGGSTVECPVLDVNIVRNARAATIYWTQVTGTTQMYITRSEFRNNIWTEQVTYTIDNPSHTSFTEPANSLSIGGTYRYAMSVESVRGLESCGETISVSVIPASTDLRNINTQAYARSMNGLVANNLTGLNTTGSATVLNSDLTVRGVNRSATTTRPLANARYTVARGLNNQLSWNGTYGTIDYLIIRDNVEIGRVPANTTGSSTTESNQKYYFIDPNQAYGNTHQYQIVARNNGGNNLDEASDGEAIKTSAHTLISPPSANSVYTVEAHDTEIVTNGNALSSNTITVKATQNVAGFRAKYASSEMAADCTVGIPQNDVTDPTAVGYRMDDNISVALNNGFMSTVNSTALTQTGVAWGTSTCYRLIPFNDAGSYPYNEGASNSTARVKADQIPERFLMNEVNSGTRFYNADYSEWARVNSSVYRGDGSVNWGMADCLLYAGPNKDQFGSDLPFCDGSWSKTSWGGPTGAGNFSPVGAVVPQQGQHQMFRNQNLHQVYGTQQEIISRWAVSRGARSGYELTRQVENAPSGRGTISGYSNTRVENIPFVTGNQTNNGIRFSGEFPGVVMSISMKSKAMNGLQRTAIANVNPGNSSKFMFATNPAPSLSVRGGYFTNLDVYGTRSTQTLSRPSHGFGGVATVVITNRGSTILNQSVDVTNGHQFWSGPFASGDLALYRTITWNTGTYGSKASGNFNSSGYVAYTGQYSYGWWAENYPEYWGNMSTRYEGRHSLDATSPDRSYWPNDRIILQSGQSAPVFDNEIGSVDVPPSSIIDCSVLPESLPDFESHHCQYGTGIAAPVKDLRADRTGASTYDINWTADVAATSYRVKVTQGVNPVLDTTTSNLNVALSGITTPNLTYTVVVTAINEAGEGEESMITFVSSPTPAQVTNLTAVRQANGTTWKASWTASALADSYTVTLYQGTTQIQSINVTGTTRDFNNITTTNTTYKIVVIPHNIAGAGPAAEVTFTTPPPTTPPLAPSNITLTLVSGNTYTATWTPVLNVDNYYLELKNSEDIVTNTLTVPGNTTTANFVLPRGHAYSAFVQSVNEVGASIPRKSAVLTLVNPLPVTNIQVTPVGAAGYKVTWDAAEGANDYRVIFYRGSTVVGSEAITGTETTRSISIINDGSQYSVAITTRGKANTASSPVSKSFTTLVAPGNALSPTVASRAGHKANLTWPSVAGANAGYDIQITSANGFSKIVPVTGLSASVIYPSDTTERSVKFQIRGKSTEGLVGPWSPVRTVQVLDNDYNNDGYGDWLTHGTGGSGIGQIWKGNGTGSQSGAINNGSGWNSSFQTRGGMDYNGDGNLDILSYSNNTRLLYFYSGAGNGTTPNSVSIGSPLPVGSRILAQGDFNADGNADFILASGTSATLYKGDGQGGFTTSLAFAMPVTATSVTPVEAGDFNGDGHLDIFFKYGDTHRIMFNSGTGTFPTYSQAGNGWSSIRVMTPRDLNGDGRADVIVRAGNDLRTYIVDNNGLFTSYAVISNGMGSGWSTWTQWSMLYDMTNDGRADMHTVNGADGLLYFAKGHTTNSNNNPFSGTLVNVGSGWNGMKVWENVNV